MTCETPGDVRPTPAPITHLGLVRSMSARARIALFIVGGTLLAVLIGLVILMAFGMWSHAVVSTQLPTI